MDDDVKNLFQKFGQATNSYQEINRDTDSEQAKQRWPLLRDVRLTEVPTHFSHGGDSAESATSPTMEQGVAQQPVSTFFKPSATTPAPSKKEVMVQASPVFASSVADVGISGKPNPSSSIFSVNASPVASTLGDNKRFHQEDTKSSQESQATLFSGGNKITANIATPETLNVERHISASAKSRSVKDVFKRLLNQQETPPVNESPVNSFFKKIFKS
ncbi:cellulose biosynthesis protein BcsP [Undibacterium sp. RuRC25W]|uniref:cellulose biosynthesis protein BcsP n=1 Tax=Undibacterium sp. RuRC25W TaxID=3413047 RepID=UPI003BF1933E